jgi:hypothetical protein
MTMDIAEFTLDELSEEHGTRLPARHLMQTLSVSVTITVGVSGLPGAPGLPGLPPAPALPGVTVG